MVSVQGRAALVTGGQRGLGAAFAAELLARGASRVYVTARRPHPSDDPRLVALALEVTDDDAVVALAQIATDVSIVVNNAGIVGGIPLLTSPIEAVASVFDTNVLGPLRIVQAFAPILARHEESALVDIHSVTSWMAGTGAYGASKAALWSVTNSLRLELGAQNTTVTGVHLNLADTTMSTRFTETPKNDPRDVARLVVDGVERGDVEVLLDEVTRQTKARLSGPVEDLVAELR